MSDSPDHAEQATTQLLPALADGANEEAWRAFVARYRPRILRWRRGMQADDAEEVASRVLQNLVVGLSGGCTGGKTPAASAAGCAGWSAPRSRTSATSKPAGS
jgi:hypothetical protein